MRETPQGPEPSGSSVSDVAAQALSRWADRPGPLLPILHEIQETLGYIPGEVVPQIARGLNLSRAEVHGVI
ncbi:MAG: NAD(P)H-dependent oxidoreductase subunit E, partial [Betaproteobacteria bacterium]|nr:NAD(P)H-dependent oxidoreductase subunit E [Betaproteobacteria bacterium]